jgi:hypothetical protein
MTNMPVSRLVIGFALTMAAAVSSSALAERILCQFDVNDSRHSLAIQQNDDVYVVHKIDLPGEFRFAGQWLSSLNKFKAYIYHTPRDRYVLLALQEFDLLKNICPQDFGHTRVYDAANERELFFHCRKSCSGDEK